MRETAAGENGTNAILSVGIDVGTTTTQVIFSRIFIENTAGYFTAPRISIVDKKVLYRGRIHPTPLIDSTLLDGEAIREIVRGEFAAAGFTPENTDTGAVIITGESAGKKNAEVVTRFLSDFAGEFVVSTAGPDIESVIAGKGSGAWQYSIDNECRVVNLDIGGGTTNIAWFDCGETAAVCCLNIGGHLILIDGHGKIKSVSPPAELVARALGIELRAGMRADSAVISRVTDKMTELICQALGQKPREKLLYELVTAGSSPLPENPAADKICFSGGVADCMNTGGAEDKFAYGDIGVLLGGSIKKESALVSDGVRLAAGETIRATVIGAGTYTTTLSGSTIFCTEGILPLKNLPVCSLSDEEQQRCIDGEYVLLENRIRHIMAQTAAENVLIAVPGKDDPTYTEIKRLAESVCRAAEGALPENAPVLFDAQCDMAKAMGYSMHNIVRGRRGVISIDGICVSEHDFVDIGKPLMGGMVVPVIVKTLLFG